MICISFCYFHVEKLKKKKKKKNCKSYPLLIISHWLRSVAEVFRLGNGYLAELRKFTLQTAHRMAHLALQQVC